MSGGEIGSYKYCNYDGKGWDNKDWEGDCDDKCEGASSKGERREMCEYGCRFWEDNCLNDFCGAEN
jgi:hypothetical protein